MSTIQLGLIGAGAIAGLTARDFARHPEVAIRAVADVNVDRARSLANQYPGAEAYAEADALLDRTDLDAVYIAVPNLHHEAAARAALAAGKHVLLDKPFAMDVHAAERIAATAEASDRLLMIGMNQRFERSVQRAHELCRQDRFGEIYHVKAYWRRRAGIPRLGSWFTSRSVSGGGALLDIGVHVLDVALHLLDDFNPVAVSGATFTRFGNRGLGEGGWGISEREHEAFDVDDFATALIRMESGVVVSLDAAWALHQESAADHDVILYGEDAGMSVFSDRLFEPGDSGDYRVIQHAHASPLPFPHCSRAHHFVNVLLGTEQPLVTIEQALTVQRILDAIYQSAESGREVIL
jgi:predicted dehydrogenase